MAKKIGAPYGNKNAQGNGGIFGGFKQRATAVDAAKKVENTLYKKYGSNIVDAWEYNYKAVSDKTGGLIPVKAAKAYGKADDILWDHYSHPVRALVVNRFRKTKGTGYSGDK